MKEAISTNLIGRANPRVQYYLATDASKQVLKNVLFQLQDVSVGIKATNSYKNTIQIIMFMFFWLEDMKTRYTVTKHKALTVLRCLPEVKWLVQSSNHATKLYTDHKVLKTILTVETNIHERIIR